MSSIQDSVTALSVVAVSLAAFMGGCASANEAPVENSPAVTGAAPSITYEEFVKQTPYDDERGVYIVEWDRPIKGEQALREYYLNSYGPSGALLVEQDSGRDSLWSRLQRWKLSYCIAKSEFGSKYDMVNRAVRSAAAAWENVADVRFPHPSAEDSNCTWSNNNVAFEIHATANKTYEAMTVFFPTDPRSYRQVYIDMTDSFTELHLTDVMTHELGHVLGFKHEHVRNPASKGSCLDSTSDYRAITGYDGLSVMHYPQCPGSLVTSGRLTISQRDIEGAQSIYEAPTNVVHCNGTLYARQRSTGDLYRYTPDQGWLYFDVPDQGYVCGGTTLYVQEEHAGALWKNYLFNWTRITEPVAQFFGCPYESVCATNIDTRDNVTGGAIHMFNTTTQTLDFIGAAGAKFAASYNTLLGLGQRRDYVAVYNGLGQSWTTLPGGGALDLIGSGSASWFVYRTTLDGEKLQRYTENRAKPWTDVYTGKVSQWHAWGGWLFAIGLSGTELYKQNIDRTQTFIDGDSVRAYTDTTPSSSCLFVADNAENIWRWCHNTSSWTSYGQP
jgi:hypothetical protein